MDEARAHRTDLVLIFITCPMPRHNFDGSYTNKGLKGQPPTKLGMLGGKHAARAGASAMASPRLQGYLAHKSCPPPQDYHKSLDVGLL